MQTTASFTCRTALVTALAAASVLCATSAAAQTQSQKAQCKRTCKRISFGNEDAFDRCHDKCLKSAKAAAKKKAGRTSSDSDAPKAKEESSPPSGSAAKIAWTKCGPAAPSQVLRVCRLLTLANECRKFMNDTRYKKSLADVMAYAAVTGLPFPSQASAARIKGLHATFKFHESLMQQCLRQFGKSGQIAQEKSFGEKVADTKVGQAVEKAGNKIGAAAAALKKVILDRMDHLIGWVKANAKSLVKSAIKKGVATLVDKGADFVLARVQAIIERAVKNASGRILPLSRKAKLGVDICRVPFILKAVSTACTTALNWVGVACVPGCPLAAAGLISVLQARFEKWATGKIYGSLKALLSSASDESGDGLLSKLNAKIDQF